MPRFHISPGSEKEGVVMLDKAESHHALAVLRLKAGEVVELLDGQGGIFQGIVAGAERGLLKISVARPSRPPRSAAIEGIAAVARPSRPPRSAAIEGIAAVRGDSKQNAESRVTITLAVSVIKPERMELLIQKSCELAAHSVIPLISERTVVRLSRERWQSKIQRWQKIARESCKQCGRSLVPVIQPVMEFKKFAETISQYDLSLIPTLALPVQGFCCTLNANKSAKSLLILIGPEGDFSRNEALLAVERGAKPVSLGPLVLRSETAALYALAVVNFFYQEVTQ